MSEQYHIFEPRQRPRQSRNGLIVVLLLFLLVVLTLAYANLRGGDSGNGYSDEQNEAFQLAQDTQTWRKRHPSPGNYGQAAIRLTYNDGTVSSWDVSTIEEGFDDADGANSTHSEQLIHTWVMKTLTAYSGRRDWSGVASLTIVYYSQVQVCGPCKIDMRPWINEYTQEAGKTVTVSIWQHVRFYIRTPSTGAVSTPDDVVEVPIKWDKP